jgi:protein TonB
MVRRASWVGALVLSIAAHGAVVAAFTPDPNQAIEAGSGAGSSIEGSIDATLGSDVAIENLASEELKTALDTEIAPAVEPTELAALAPSLTETEPTQPTETAVAPAETQAVEAPAVSELAETEPSAIAPALAADISATPIESDLPAAPSTELSEIVPTETLTAVAPTVSATPETLPAATSAAEATPVERPVEKPMQTAVLTAIKPVETPAPQEVVPEELVPLPEAKPVEVTPVEKQEETKPVEALREAPRPVEKKLAEKAEPTRKPAREKAEKAEKKQKAQAPRRGDAEADSDRGASVASRDSKARDNGIGRSRESGFGAAANSNYQGKVRAKIVRATQMPSKARRLGISGRAHVRFTITTSGAARNIVLASSTGNPMLDDAALSAVRKASPFPRMPDGMSQLDLSVPIVFNVR